MLDLSFTAEQRYRQAIWKARIQERRNLRKFMRGELDHLPASDERGCIIAELNRLIEEARRAP